LPSTPFAPAVTIDAIQNRISARLSFGASANLTYVASL
jgi:hypothetical protein